VQTIPGTLSEHDRGNDLEPLIFATFLAPTMEPFHAAVAEYVGTRVGLGSRLVTGTSLDQISAREADVAFAARLPYIRLADDDPEAVEPLAAPVVAQPRYEGRPISFSDVVVRSGSGLTSFADLRGRAVSYEGTGPGSDYGLILRLLAERGEVEGYFGRVVEAGGARRSLELLLAGATDASVVDSHVLAVAVRDRPGLAEQLCVVDTLGPAPTQPVVAARRLPAGLRSEIRHLLASMHQGPQGREVLALGLVERFAEVDDATYDPIRRMLAAA
jgi:phosphonate transport system substrate-binding protein